MPGVSSPTYVSFSHEELTYILDMARERLNNSIRERKRITERNAKLGRSEDKRLPELEAFITTYRNVALKALMGLEAMEGEN